MPWTEPLIVYPLLVVLGLITAGLGYTLAKRRANYLVQQAQRQHSRLATQYAELQKYYQAQQQRNEYLQTLANQAGPRADAAIEWQGTTDAPTDETALTVHNLAEEMENFRRRNRKLWAQSIAVHREKERIEGLKREIEHKHRELTDSIRYAKRIQTALLPRATELAETLPQHFILWRPRDIVSGDFFWIKQVEHRTIVVVADCTGHGVPGAFMSMLGISFLNELANSMQLIAANQVLEALRERVKTSLQQESADHHALADGMDMALCIADRKARTIQFAGANNPLMLVRQGRALLYKPTRNPIGIYRKERPFECTDIPYLPGDTFYLFSDGILDQFGGPKNQKYGLQQLKDAVESVAAFDMPAQLSALESNIDQWRGDQRQLDDILLLGFRC